MSKFRIVPLILSIAIFVIGFYYSVIKAGIPYQDPTPAMTEKYISDMSFGDTCMLAGIIMCVASVVLLIVLKAYNNKKQKR